MMPVEWPIAAPAAERSGPARDAGSGRLRTVRADFFLNPAERLSEQERALMTAMLHCLISDVAAEIRAKLPAGWAGANDDDVVLVDALMRAGLLDQPELIALLLKRADEERIGTAARARSGRRDARVIQGLVSHHNSAVSAAAMALILARGRRRDRFGQCLVSFDDLPAPTAARLVYAIAAALRSNLKGKASPSAVDRELGSAAARIAASHDPLRGIEALTSNLVALIAAADGGPSDEIVLGCAQEGEVCFLAEVLARRSGISLADATEELLSGEPRRLMALFRIAGMSRDLSAGILATIGDIIGIADAGAAIAIFDAMSEEDVQASAAWLGAPLDYRSALDALGGANG